MDLKEKCYTFEGFLEASVYHPRWILSPGIFFAEREEFDLITLCNRYTLFRKLKVAVLRRFRVGLLPAIYQTIFWQLTGGSKRPGASSGSTGGTGRCKTFRVNFSCNVCVTDGWNLLQHWRNVSMCSVKDRRLWTYSKTLCVAAKSRISQPASETCL